MTLTRTVPEVDQTKTGPATPTNFQYLLKQLVGCHKCVNSQKRKLRVHIERTRIYSTISSIFFFFVYLPSFSFGGHTNIGKVSKKFP